MILACRDHRCYNVSKNSTACNTRVISLPRKYSERSSYTITVSEVSSSQIDQDRKTTTTTNTATHLNFKAVRLKSQPRIETLKVYRSVFKTATPLIASKKIGKDGHTALGSADNDSSNLWAG